MAESQNNPLHYFEELLTSNKYESLKRRFVNDGIETSGSQLHSSDFQKGIYQVSYNDEGTIGVSTLVFDKEFPKEIKSEEINTISKIDNSVLEITKKGISHKEFLKLQVHNIYILEESSKKHYPSIIEIQSSLNNILCHIVDKYNLKESYKKQNIEIIGTSFFDLKSDVKFKDLVQIYDLAIELEIFDDEIVSEEDFILILSAGDIMSINNKIVFKCNNQIAIHFIEIIQPLFNELTFSRLDKSEKFHTKGGKILNQRDFDSAKSRLKNKKSPRIDKITTAFDFILK